jgi:hypothetical protein
MSFKLCAYCDTQFTPHHGGSKFCSSECRSKARSSKQPSTEGLDSRSWQDNMIFRRQADGFISATAMCDANGRQWSDYIRSDRTQEYIHALAASSVSGSGLMDTCHGQEPYMRGRWIHPRLAIDLARWISPAFVVWMEDWIAEANAQDQHVVSALPVGVHVVAANPRQAAQLWCKAVTTQVQAALAVELSPQCRHDRNLPLAVHYRWQPQA